MLQNAKMWVWVKCAVKCKEHTLQNTGTAVESYPNLNPNPFLHLCENSTGSQALAQQQKADAGPVLS